MCVEVPPENALAEHAAVFEGRVVSLERESGMLVARFDVVQHWKGVEVEHAVVRTAESSAACGVSFEVGTSWLIYADREGEALTTGICSRTRRIEDAGEDLAELGAGVVPIEIGPEDEVEERDEAAPVRAGCASCAVFPSGGFAPPARAPRSHVPQVRASRAGLARPPMRASRSALATSSPAPSPLILVLGLVAIRTCRSRSYRAGA
jgi:hypothetical protein